PFRSRYPNAPYNGAIAYVDATVGKLLDYLRSQGLYDNALIAVAADHGESLGEHGELTHSIFLTTLLSTCPCSSNFLAIVLPPNVSMPRRALWIWRQQFSKRWGKRRLRPCRAVRFFL